LQNAVASRLIEINKLLVAHELEFNNDPQYGYLGDLAHVDKLLGEVVAFLKNSD
jgi:hypothetical protein